MKSMGIQGIIRGKSRKTTIPDRVNRRFRAPAPDMLSVSDFTQVATGKGSVHAAVVIDALEQTVRERHPAKGMGMVPRGDGGSQYLSVRCTDRLAEAGTELQDGSVGDTHDNALAETIIRWALPPHTR